MIARLSPSFALLLLLAFASSSAHAYAIRYATSPLGNLVTSDTVQVDLYLDADPGLQLLSIGVLWETDRLDLQPLASSSAPSILETVNPGPGEAASVDRLRDPWVEWPGDKPPGFSQVNVDYASAPDFFPAPASGTNIWLTSLVFHVIDGAGGVPVIDVTLGTSSNILQANGVVVDPADVPITLIPEPMNAVLLGLGIALAAAGGRRARG